MEYILAFFNFISNLGATVMMPIIITILGLILGAPFGRALRAGLTVGVGGQGGEHGSGVLIHVGGGVLVGDVHAGGAGVLPPPRL